MQSKLEDAVTIREAARRLKTRPAPLRRFVLKHRLAIDWLEGGRRIKVRMSELEKKILDQRVIGKNSPPPRRRQSRIFGAAANPDITF